jgi:hypothetical protein
MDKSGQFEIQKRRTSLFAVDFSLQDLEITFSKRCHRTAAPKKGGGRESCEQNLASRQSRRQRFALLVINPLSKHYRSQSTINKLSESLDVQFPQSHSLLDCNSNSQSQ